MKKSNGLVPKKASEVTKYINPKNAGLSLVEEIKSMESIEDLGTSIYQTSHQFYLVIQSILQAKFGFDEKELKDLNQEVTKAIEGLAYFEDKGLHPLSVHSAGQLVDVTMNHYETLKAARSGLELPTSKQASKLLHGDKKWK